MLVPGCARASSRARVTLPRSGICRMWRTHYMSSPAVKSLLARPDQSRRFDDFEDPPSRPDRNAAGAAQAAAEPAPPARRRIARRDHQTPSRSPAGIWAPGSASSSSLSRCIMSSTRRSDHMIWDVGHQTYPHKILTGRRDRIRTLRQGGGLSGFTKRAESEYDAFGAGHSSTSISAGLGMAVARDLSASAQQCRRRHRRQRHFAPAWPMRR